MSHDNGHHIIPISTLLKVFGALILLTILTVVTARYIDFGVLEVPVAIAIASTKSGLVVAVFMALKYDERINSLVFIVGTLFVGVFLAFTLLDTAFRGDVGNISYQTISEMERQEEMLREREPDPEALRIAPGDFPDEDQDAEPEAMEDPEEEQGEDDADEEAQEQEENS